MPFGSTGAPHTFQRVVNSTLGPVLRKCVLVFLDDILIYSQSYEDHLQHLEQVFQLLQKEQWRIKHSSVLLPKGKSLIWGIPLVQQEWQPILTK
jgi:hypothetical protein